MKRRSRVWVVAGTIVVLSSIGVVAVVYLPWYIYPFVLPLLLGIINSILLPISREKTAARLSRREAELRKSWDELRIKGKILHYSEWVEKRLVFAGFALAIFMVYIAVILAVAIESNIIPASQSQNRSALESFVSIAALSLLLPWLIFIHVAMTRHEVSSSGIRKGSPWARSFYVNWAEVQEVSYSYLLDSYVVKTTKGKIRLRALLDGIGFFVEMVSENVPHERRASLDSRQKWTI